MATYLQDSVPRTCTICTRPIEKDQWMIDLFRQSADKQVEWCHEKCGRNALEIFIVKRDERRKNEPKEPGA